MKIQITFVVPCFCALLFAVSCASSSTSTPNITPQSNTHETGTVGHKHTAQHGGTLVALGEEFAHIEFVLDDVAGKLTAYVLDAEAEKAVPLKIEEFEVQLKSGNDVTAEFTVKLKAVENKLTGETVGNTSEFSVQDDKLKGLKNFNTVIKSIGIKGQIFNNVEFNFPNGNEHNEKEIKEKKTEHNH